MPRLRGLQWMILLDVALVAREHWSRLENADQRRLAEILRRGRNMSARDRKELRRIVAKLELLDAGRELMPIIGRRGKKRR
jgi:hypothetical protein